MAISVDTVYQRVLALANKEQRGYITPQEFNLFANQAQQEIFEQYFYDINQWNRQHGNSTEYSDMLNLLDEKIEIFQTSAIVSLVSSLDDYGIYNLATITDLYRVGTITYVDSSVSPNPIILEKVSEKEFLMMQQSPLTKPVATRPVYFSSSMFGVNLTASINDSNIDVYYTRKPKKVEWGYFVINDKALWDSNPLKTKNFELHASEESELVYRILAYAGITLQKTQLTQSAVQLESVKVQQEKQ
jgi:hypothetical protein